MYGASQKFARLISRPAEKNDQYLAKFSIENGMGIVPRLILCYNPIEKNNKNLEKFSIEEQSVMH